MKKIFKIILFKFLGKAFYALIKPIYSPPPFLREKLRFLGKFKVKTADGKNFHLYNNAFLLETNIYWVGMDQYAWEKMTRKIWTRLCVSSDSIFDIGSNSGIFATLAKVYNPKAKVVAFEPQPNIFQVLKKNNEINDFDITCENMALSNEEGNMPFYNYGPDPFNTGNTTAGSLNKNWRTEDQKSIMVKVKSLDNYVNENNIQKIDLMKIDVETFEYEMLSGYLPVLFLHQPIILLEIQNREIGMNIESIFRNKSYVFYNIDEEKGLERVDILGFSEINQNYVLCPDAKGNLMQEFIHS